MQTDRIPVIIDTDIGDDIDDAFALCFAMQCPELDILGITTVYKDTVRRAKIAARLLHLGGCGLIPVAAGCGIPYNNPYKFGIKQDFTEKPWTYIDENDQEDIDLSRDAEHFIVDTLLHHPFPVTIITLGPLTNIARVIQNHPEAKERIHRIVIMGGAYSMNFMENNIACDPEAAQIVFDSGIDIVGVGVDVTFRCKLDDGYLKQLEQNPHPCIQFLMHLRKNWNHDVYLHDPLAVAIAFNESLVTTEKRCYAVELDGKYSRSMTVNLSDHNWQYDPSSSNLKICTDVDSERFIRLYMERVLRFN